MCATICWVDILPKECDASGQIPIQLGRIEYRSIEKARDK
jgi:hypothetical protein